VTGRVVGFTLLARRSRAGASWTLPPLAVVTLMLTVAVLMTILGSG
jgi:hypothetical protein